MALLTVRTQQLLHVTHSVTTIKFNILPSMYVFRDILKSRIKHLSKQHTDSFM